MAKYTDPEGFEYDDGKAEPSGLSATNIFNRGTDVLSSYLKPKPAALAPAKPVAAPVAPKTNFMPFIIGGIALVVVGGIALVVVMMGGRRGTA